MARIDTLGNFLSDVANAIRTAEGSSDEITASDFDDRIEALSGGGSDVSDYFVSTLDNPYGNDRISASLLKKVPGNITITGTCQNLFYYCLNLEEIGLINTTGFTDMRSMFSNCKKLSTIPIIDTSSVTNMNQMFSGSGIETMPLLDTSNVTDMRYMFSACTNLKNMPVLDTSSVTKMDGMFGSNANALTDESVNNILQMCINATNYTSTKKLTGNSGMGLNIYTYTQARVSALSNYQAFLDAGWVW